jgi:hypothetical protein
MGSRSWRGFLCRTQHQKRSEPMSNRMGQNHEQKRDISLNLIKTVAIDLQTTITKNTHCRALQQ